MFRIRRRRAGLLGVLASAFLLLGAGAAPCAAGPEARGPHGTAAAATHVSHAPDGPASCGRCDPAPEDDDPGAPCVMGQICAPASLPVLAPELDLSLDVGATDGLFRSRAPDRLVRDILTPPPRF